MTENVFLEFKTGSDFPEPRPTWVQSQPVFGVGAVPVFVFEDTEAVGGALAVDIVALLEAKEDGGQFLLGCPSGRSLQSTYAGMAKLAHQEDLDLSNLVIVMMDEYLDQGPSGLVHCPDDAHYSCVAFARTSILELLNAGLPDAGQIPKSNLWVPDPADPGRFDRRIADAGGVDLFLIASGASDGHVAFNPPGARLDSPTQVVELANSTRRDNMDTFPAFTDLDEVPRFGVSVGLGTISGLSHRVALVLTSSEKMPAARELARRRTFESDWPATVIFECDEPAIFVDRSAAVGFENQGTVH